MKITLELEDFRFTTTKDSFPTSPYGQTERRWLMVMVAGKQFVVQREVEPDWMYGGRHREQIDKTLVEEMQLMLESVLLNAVAAVPRGVIEIKCPSGEFWRFHYAGRCACKSLKEIADAATQSAG